MACMPLASRSLASQAAEGAQQDAATTSQAPLKPAEEGMFSSGARKVTMRLGGRRPSGSAPSLHGVVHVSNSSNNVILSLTDESGAVKAWSSAGSAGFKNARKSLPGEERLTQ